MVMRGVGGRWVASAVAVLALAVATGCGAETDGSGSGGDQASASLKKCDSPPDKAMIGATLPMSSSGAPYGQMFSKSLQFAIDDVNSAGGVGGKTKLELKVLDDKGLAGPAVQQMRQLVSSDKAIAIVSAYNDPPLAQSKLGQQLKTPVFNGGGNGVDLGGKAYLWNNVATVAQETERIANYAKDKLNAKKVAVLAATNYTKSDLAAVRKLLEDLFGASNAKMVTFDPDATDVKPQLQQIKSFGPDYVLFTNSGTLTQNAAKNASEINLGIPILGTSGTLYEPDILKQPSMDGAYASAMDFQPPSDFATKAKERTGVDANAFIDNYASIIKVIAQSGDELIKDGYCFDGANINAIVAKHAKEGKPFEGYAGEVAYTPEGTSGRPLKILKAEKGKIVEVEKPQTEASGS
jgi:ABC-type branched-subunit amino acid transport system substrate-binding protein